MADAEVDSADESEEEWNYIPGVDGKGATEEGRTDKKSQVVEEGPEKTHRNDGDNDEDEDDMSRLNPNAAEFVPVLGAEVDVVLACSPAKGQERSIEHLPIPKQKDFLDEISTKPADLDNSDYEFNLCEAPVNGVGSPHKPAPEESDNSSNDEQIEISNTTNHVLETDFFGLNSVQHSAPEVSNNPMDVIEERHEPVTMSNPFVTEEDPIQNRMVNDYFGEGLQMDLKQFDPMQNSMIILGSTPSPMTPDDHVADFIEPNSASDADKDVTHDAENVEFDAVKIELDSKVDLVPESIKPDLVCPVDDSPDVIEESRDDHEIKVDFGKCDLIANVPTVESVVDEPLAKNPFVDELIEPAQVETSVVENHDEALPVDLSNKINPYDDSIVEAVEENGSALPSDIVEEIVHKLDNVDLSSSFHFEKEPEHVEHVEKPVDVSAKDEEEGVEVIQFNFAEVKSESTDLDPVRHQFGFDSRVEEPVQETLVAVSECTKDESGDSDGFEMINYNDQSKPHLNGVDHSEETDRSPDNYKIDELVHETEIPTDHLSKSADEDFIVDEIMREVVTASSEFYPGINSVHMTDHEVENQTHELETVLEAVEDNQVSKTELPAEPINDVLNTEDSHLDEPIQEASEVTTVQCDVERVEHVENIVSKIEEVVSNLEEQCFEEFHEKDVQVDVLIEAEPINIDIPSVEKTVEIIPEISATKEVVPEVAASAPLVEELLNFQPSVAVEEKEIVEDNQKSLHDEPIEIASEVVEKSAPVEANDEVVHVTTPPSTPAPVGVIDSKEEMIAAAAAAVGVATVAAAASVLTAEAKTPTENKAVAKKAAPVKTDAKPLTKPAAKSPTKTAPSAAKPSLTGVAAKKPGVSAVPPKTPPTKAPLKTTTATKTAVPKTGVAPAKPSSPAAKPVNGVAAKPKPTAAPAAKAPATRTAAKPLTSATKTAPAPAKAPLAKPKTPTTTVPPIKKPSAAVPAKPASTLAKKPEVPKPPTATRTTTASKPSSASSTRPLSSAKPAVKSTVSTTKTLTTSTTKPAPAAKPAPAKTATAPSRPAVASKTPANPTSKATAKPAAPKPKPAAPTALKKPPGADKTAKDAVNKTAPNKGAPIKKPTAVDSKSKAPAKIETGEIPLNQEPVVSTTTNGHVNGNISDDSPVDFNCPLIADVPAAN